jgi:hypothetical protein
MKLKFARNTLFQFKYLPFVIIFLISTISLIFYFPPTFQLQLHQFRISIITFFLLSLFLLVYFTWVFILKSRKHGLFLALFVVTYLVFRLNNLTEPLFLFLLIALYLTLEFLLSDFTRKRREKLKRE